MFFIKIPNSAPKEASILIAQESHLLSKLSFKYFIPTVQIKSLPPSLAYHADLQIHYLGKGVFLSCPEAYGYYCEKLVPLGAKVIKGQADVSGNYPNDAAYNIVRVGSKAYHNTKYTEKTAKAYFEREDVTLIHINQGYAKCLTAVTGENSIMTSDAGIYNTACAHGTDSLLIEQGYITLDGFSYGFLGGASCLLPDNKFFITGSLKNHPSRHKILSFLEKQELEPVEAVQNPPVDIGSLIIA
ncbi:MAG: hypothetical protein IJT38_03465 [Clostridia bacterium]|nr:hypothetical protein [Clostridia bacterium]